MSTSADGDPHQTQPSTPGAPSSGSSPSPFSRDAWRSPSEGPPSAPEQPATEQFDPGRPEPRPGGASGGEHQGYGEHPGSPNPYGQGPYSEVPYPSRSQPTSWQGGYPQPVGGPAAPLPYVPQATVTFVLGLLSVLICPVTGPAAIVLARQARKQLAAEPGRYGGEGLVTAGLILGIVGTIAFAGLVVLTGIAVVGLLSY